MIITRFFKFLAHHSFIPCEWGQPICENLDFSKPIPAGCTIKPTFSQYIWSLPVESFHWISDLFKGIEQHLNLEKSKSLLQIGVYATSFLIWFYSPCYFSTESVEDVQSDVEKSKESTESTKESSKELSEQPPGEPSAEQSGEPSSEGSKEVSEDKSIQDESSSKFQSNTSKSKQSRKSMRMRTLPSASTEE